MGIHHTLFPPRSRGFTGKRWVEISLRTLHLIGTAGVGGGFLWGADPGYWMPFLWITVLSGFAMAGLQIWGNGIWLIQMRGLAVIAKLLFILLMLRWGARADLFLLIIIISGVVSHAPGSVRYFSPLLMRRVEHL